MNNQKRNIESVRFIEKSNSLLLKTPDGNSWFLNLNLALYAAGIAYEKKDGTQVNEDQIRKMKAVSQKKYMAAVQSNNKARTA